MEHEQGVSNIFGGASLHVTSYVGVVRHCSGAAEQPRWYAGPVGSPRLFFLLGGDVQCSPAWCVLGAAAAAVKNNVVMAFLVLDTCGVNGGRESGVNAQQALPIKEAKHSGGPLRFQQFWPPV